MLSVGYWPGEALVELFLTASIAQCRYSKRSALRGRAARLGEVCATRLPGKDTRGVSVCLCPQGQT